MYECMDGCLGDEYVYEVTAVFWVSKANRMCVQGGGMQEFPGVADAPGILEEKDSGWCKQSDQGYGPVFPYCRLSAYICTCYVREATYMA